MCHCELAMQCVPLNTMQFERYTATICTYLKDLKGDALFVASVLHVICLIWTEFNNAGQAGASDHQALLLYHGNCSSPSPCKNQMQGKVIRPSEQHDTHNISEANNIMTNYTVLERRVTDCVAAVS